MSSVWCAYDAALGHKVAIKVLARQFVGDEPVIRRFEHEVRSAAHLSAHPHVVMIYDVAEVAGRPYVVMEHLAGGTVGDAFRVGAVRREEALRWLAEAASAVDYAHGRGVVHRDIKPGNLLLSLDRAVRVTDFGITRLPTDASQPGTDERRHAAAYLSPEQALGAPASDASDRYALAVTAFELLVGQRPFTAEDPGALARQHITDDPPQASAGNRALPRAVDAVLARGMAKRPEDRWSTAGMFVGALDAAFSEPVPARRFTAASARRSTAAAAGGSTAAAAGGSAAAAAGGSTAAAAGGSAAAAAGGSAAAAAGGLTGASARGSTPASAGGSAAARGRGSTGASARRSAAAPGRRVTVAPRPRPRRRPRRPRRSVALAALAAAGVAVGILVAMPHGGSAPHEPATLAQHSSPAPSRAHPRSAKVKPVTAPVAPAPSSTTSSAAAGASTAPAGPSANGGPPGAAGGTTTSAGSSANGTPAAAGATTTPSANANGGTPATGGATTAPAGPTANGSSPAAPSATTTAPAAPHTTTAPPAPHTTVTSATPAAPQPPSAAALEARGHGLMLDGAYAAAIPVLRQAVSVASPRDITYAYALYDLGRSLRLAGDPGAAIPILERRLQIPNQTPVVLSELRLAQRADARRGSAAGTATASARSHHVSSGPSHDGGAAVRATGR
jgi:eukaryotic-like serine/threonine-protein kinase